MVGRIYDPSGILLHNIGVNIKGKVEKVLFKRNLGIYMRFHRNFPNKMKVYYGSSRFIYILKVLN